MSRKKGQVKQRPTTLCITCKYACGGGTDYCSWAKELIQVKGWKAIKTTKAMCPGETFYLVVACPKYQEGRGLPRDGFDTHGSVRLLAALAKLTLEDYREGHDIYDTEESKAKKKYYKTMTIAERKEHFIGRRARNRQQIEKWIRGPGRELMMFADTDAIIRHLKNEARKYELRISSQNFEKDGK